MHLILPGLYVGSMFDAKNQAKLDANQITHFVSVHDSTRPFDTRRLYLCIQASDTPRQDLKDYFPMVVEFIHEARSKGGNVLVHCFAGVSRSVTLTAAYLIVACDVGWSSALKAIQAVRTTADPNFGFKKQLSFFDFEDAEQQRKRLRAKEQTS
uniref:Dual specificity protein phosphatase 15 n=1 Tax=Romanomermis culicivorax TaxID=13658 RepID=A0A915JEU3_ROMCU